MQVLQCSNIRFCVNQTLSLPCPHSPLHHPCSKNPRCSCLLRVLPTQVPTTLHHSCGSPATQHIFHADAPRFAHSPSLRSLPLALLTPPALHPPPDLHINFALPPLFTSCGSLSARHTCMNTNSPCYSHPPLLALYTAHPGSQASSTRAA